MEIFTPLNVHHHFQAIDVGKPQGPDSDFDLSDPDEMYNRWIAPSIDIFDGITQNEWRRDIENIQTIFLDLEQAPRKINSHKLLKEMSIQISIYEALLFRDIMQKKNEDTWTLSKQASSKDMAFIFQSNTTSINTTIDKTKVNVEKNNRAIGALTIDMEHVILEKVHGKLFDQPFIIDPIWLKHKKKVDSVKVQIDQFKTEIVHKKHHRQTLWIGAGESSLMTISKNDSVSVNKNLILNIKKIHWKNRTLTTLQWYTPWVRFPVQGKYKLQRD